MRPFKSDTSYVVGFGICLKYPQHIVIVLRLGFRFRFGLGVKCLSYNRITPVIVLPADYETDT